jgi:Putative restriction endonuclease
MGDEQLKSAAETRAGSDVELIEGTTVKKLTRSLWHDAAHERAAEIIGQLVPLHWQMLTAHQLVAADSRTEPDLLIIRGRLNETSNEPASPEDVPWVMEIADASLVFDRRTKRRIYARAAIPIYWLLNLPDRQLEVHSNPSGPVPMPDYQEQRVYRLGENVAFVLEEDLGLVRVGDLIP